MVRYYDGRSAPLSLKGKMRNANPSLSLPIHRDEHTHTRKALVGIFYFPFLP